MLSTDADVIEATGGVVRRSVVFKNFISKEFIHLIFVIPYNNIV